MGWKIVPSLLCTAGEHFFCFERKEYRILYSLGGDLARFERQGQRICWKRAKISEKSSWFSEKASSRRKKSESENQQLAPTRKGVKIRSQTKRNQQTIPRSVCCSRRVLFAGKTEITKRSVRRVTIKSSGKRVCVCVCVFADKSRPKRQFSYWEEGGGVVLPFCRLIAQVLPKEKNDDR